MKKILFLALACVVTAAAAFTIELTEEEKAECANQGGCAWVTRAWFIEQLEGAHQQGFNEGLQKGKEDCHLGGRRT